MRIGIDDVNWMDCMDWMESVDWMDWILRVVGDGNEIGMDDCVHV